jgi:energy-coupling factor transport system permease protein
LNPRAVAGWSGAGLLIVVLTNNPAYRLIVLLAALNLLVARRRPEARLRPVLVFLVMATVVSTVVSLALSHTGQHVLVSLPGGIPVLGGALTLESAVFGLGAGLGIAAAALVMAPLSMVLDAHQLVEALPSPLHRTGTMLAAALNLGPGIGRSAVAVREAQTLRGWRPRGARSYAEILVPVTLTALEMSIQLAEAMDARGYGSGPRTRMSPSRWTHNDKLTLVVATAAAVAIVAGRTLGMVSDWWPYPALAVPSVNAAIVVACMLLALPAVGRRND